jgi:isoleucyl-tRNA synthetase
MFEEIENESFAAREERILNFWDKEKIFETSIEHRKGAPFFSFIDGPPFATGLPHYGHLIAGTIKDAVLRFKTMEGYYVPRINGWDTHGLPIESIVEKKFELSGAPEIEQFGIAKFNEECRSSVLTYVDEWKKTMARMARWVDFNATWKTMDPTFMESVWWVFKQVYEKGLIYEGYKVMPFSAQLGTPLSNFEAGENYKEVDDPSLVIKLELEDEPGTFILVWTTTPWTLPSNLAATIGQEITYVKVAHEGSHYILAEDLYEKWFSDKEAEIVQKLSADELKGRHYLPLFDYFKEDRQKGAFRLIVGDFVSTFDGTGIVHTAPAFGEDDFYACKEEGIEPRCPVDQNGRFTKQVADFAGTFVKDADKEIIRRLKDRGLVFYRGTLRHRYPFCWRTDTPLIYRAMNTWFLNVEQLKPALMENNKEIYWMPGHIKEGRFGKWLEGARDWAISRNRYFGTPIPIWRAEDGEIHVIGSVKELEDLSGKRVEDLHRQYVDDITFEKNGKLFKRVSEVFDCWFESGSVPYGRLHYPFENQEELENGLPIDFIAEGMDQTRAWFYTLNVLSTALFSRPAFKNVVVNGIVLAEDGNKMSKRLKNYPDPMEVVHKYGADAIRLYMLNSPAVKGEDLRFAEKGVEIVLRQILIPLWNAHAFLQTYTRIYEWKPMGHRSEPEAVIDRWIIARLNKLIFDVKSSMDQYDLNHAVEPFVGFIDELTNWYIRRSRRRFWNNEDTPDRRQAFETLHHVLIELSKIAAPFIPFLSEAIYGHLKLDSMPKSVHLCDYPTYEEECRNELLEKGMELLQTAVSLGHNLRKEEKLKVRQPLAAVHVVCGDLNVMNFLKSQEHLIAQELNVKRVHFFEEKQKYVSLSIKPNFRVLGKKVGKHMKEVQKLIADMGQESIQALLQGEKLPITLEGEIIDLTDEDVEIAREVQEGWTAINAGIITVALETELTEELILEGIARELVNKINTMRRQANFAVTDRIQLTLGASEKVKRALLIHGDFVQEEVLATELQYADPEEGQLWDINGEPTKISLSRVRLS